jgi:hypothetical protein
MFKNKLLYPDNWIMYSYINNSVDIFFIHHIKYRNNWYHVTRTSHNQFYSRRWKTNYVVTTLWRTGRSP